MKDSWTIKDLEKVIRLANNQKLVGYKTKRLTQPGENYGSEIIALEVHLKDVDDESIEKTQYLVAKMCPPNEWIKKMFNIPVSFKKELAFYSTVVPTLRNFQKENGVNNLLNIYPVYWGGRISLDPSSDVVDDNAVLLLENLKTSGYVTVDRLVGFDFDTAKLLIEALAVFNAVPLAIKIKNPKLFQERIMPYLNKERSFADVSDEVKEKMHNEIVAVAGTDPECVPFLDKVRKWLEIGDKSFIDGTEIREPYATLCHNDFWVNNAMIKYLNNRPVGAKMIDIQIMDYSSPAKDLLFFIYSSIQMPALRGNFDYFAKLYHTTLVNILESFHCDSSPFTYELLLKEIAIEAKMSQLFHILIMLNPIHSLKGTVKDISELSASDMLNSKLSDKYDEKLCYVVKEFGKRNWL